MIEDVYDPLELYRSRFRDRFAALAREKFEELTRKSGIDVGANRSLAGEIAKLQSEADSARSRRNRLGCLAVIGFAVAAVMFAIALTAGDSAETAPLILYYAGTAAGTVLGFSMIPLYGTAARHLSKLQARISGKKNAAWRQMEPLNRLYAWDIPVRLIEETVPGLDFDPCFTASRLDSLRSRYGWDDSFNDGKSVIFAQSGVVNGNPFVFCHYLEMEWGEETYEGTKEISWTEWETDSDGKRRPVRKFETLRAYVTKPIPVYAERKLLVYGSDAAPNLSFSREPSGLTGKEGEFWAGVRKKWRLSRLKAYSRNLDDDSNFTLMANHEFETWFHAKDRNNEVEFRLLFTPVAQRRLLELMKDASTGYGDDFAFVKLNKINVLASKHLDEGTIDTDPARFRNWSYDAAAAFFIDFNTRYFKDVYFSLAPLLSIPSYLHAAGDADAGKPASRDASPSSWEYESIANYHGEDKFKHPECVTRSLLKTRAAHGGAGETTVAVTAHGYRGEDRVDFECVYGGDGKLHEVPVRWIEYIPVERTSAICVSADAAPDDSFMRRASMSKECVSRRSVRSFIQ